MQNTQMLVGTKNDFQDMLGEHIQKICCAKKQEMKKSHHWVEMTKN